MTAIAIGTAQFGLNYGIANKTGKVDGTEVREILSVARKNGADTLDTAIAYGGAEATLGNIGCANWNVVTKLPLIPPDIKDVQGWVSSEVSKSLFRLILRVCTRCSFTLQRICWVHRGASSLMRC